MKLLFADYTNLIIKAYEERRDNNRLSQLLMHPTTANIRQACLNAYNEKTGKGEQVEENTLTAFFGVPPTGKNFGYAIERYPADRFRPIRSLIRREIKNPTLVNVELLAWLIDFTPRPLGVAQKMIGINGINDPVNLITNSSTSELKTDQKGANIVVKVEDSFSDTNNVNTKDLVQDEGNKMSITGNGTAGNDSAKNPGDRSQDGRLIRIAAIILIIAFVSGGTYLIWQQVKPGSLAFWNVNTGCMYWADDHYEQVPCSEERKGRLILPLNEEKIKYFKKITREDTITEKSIGVIFYIRRNGDREYFTTGGTHPVHVTDTLKVLSRYMFDKYLRKKEVQGKDSLVE